MGMNIRDLGCEVFLNASRSQHNGYGYDDFVNLVGENFDKPKIDKANLARVFGVTRMTIYDWLDALKAEMAKK